MRLTGEFKLSLIRMFYGMFIVGSLLNNIGYSAWQSVGLTEAMMYLSVFAVSVCAAIAVFLGYCTWVAIPVLAVSIFASHLMSRFLLEIHFFMHAQIFLTLGLLILNASSTERYFSISSPKDGFQNSETALKLFKWFLIAVYWGSALAKLNGEYLSGFALETQLIRYSYGSLPLPFTIPAWAFSAMAISAFLAELILPFFLLWSRTATAAVFAALIFHMIMLGLLHPEWLSFAMPAGLVAFLDDKTIERWFGITLPGQSNS